MIALMAAANTSAKDNGAAGLVDVPSPDGIKGNQFFLGVGKNDNQFNDSDGISFGLEGDNRPGDRSHHLWPDADQSQPREHERRGCRHRLQRFVVKVANDNGKVDAGKDFTRITITVGTAAASLTASAADRHPESTPS